MACSLSILEVTGFPSLRGGGGGSVTSGRWLALSILEVTYRILVTFTSSVCSLLTLEVSWTFNFRGYKFQLLSLSRGNDSLESIFELIKSLKIPALMCDRGCAGAL